MTTPTAPTTPAPPVAFAARHTPTGRLGQGELRRQVAAHLAATSSDHTSGEIARALGARSSGAVANALETLVERGQAELTTARPRRFRATATTADATRGGTPKGGTPAGGTAPSDPSAVSPGSAPHHLTGRPHPPRRRAPRRPARAVRVARR